MWTLSSVHGVKLLEACVEFSGLGFSSGLQSWRDAPIGVVIQATGHQDVVAVIGNNLNYIATHRHARPHLHYDVQGTGSGSAYFMPHTQFLNGLWKVLSLFLCCKFKAHSYRHFLPQDCI